VAGTLGQGLDRYQCDQHSEHANGGSDQARQTEDEVQRLLSTQPHALNSVVKRRRLEGEQVDRSCYFQDLLLDVAIYQFTEDLLPFTLGCRDK
jgi:hypothetical protein